jgi:hypothetical protein
MIFCVASTRIKAFQLQCGHAALLNMTYMREQQSHHLHAACPFDSMSSKANQLKQSSPNGKMASCCVFYEETVLLFNGWVLDYA